MQKLFIFAILLSLSVLASSSYVYPHVMHPIKEGDEAVLIMITGSLTKPNQYFDIAKEIQTRAPLKLWVVIPQFTSNLASAIELRLKMIQIRHVLKSKGIQNPKIFMTGHSKGGVAVQNYLKQHREGVLGQILTGSILMRNKYTLSPDGRYLVKSPLPTLTLAGEKDGLSRITRTAEAYYRLNTNCAFKNPNDQFNLEFPVVMLEGVNHMDFANGGNNFETSKRDLQSEVTLATAHEMISSSFVDFMTFIYQRNVIKNASYNYTYIPGIIQNSLQYFLPIIEAFQMEGSYFLKPPCFNKPNINPPSSYCTHGSPWVEYAQSLMSDVQSVAKNVQVSIDDSSHRVWSATPEHFPHIWNDCKNTPANSTCVLNMTTVSQNHYQTYTKTDFGSFGGSAYEIRAKLTSRQNAYSKVGVPNPEFKVTDGPNQCSSINQKAINWALGRIPQRTLDRYMDHGMQMVIGDDLGPYNQGFRWISHKIKYEKVQSADGTIVLRVRSPYMATPIKFIIPKVAGLHYCKLLSPLKVMEWVFTASLEDSEQV